MKISECSIPNYTASVDGICFEETSIDGLMQARFYEAKGCLKIEIVLQLWWKASLSNLNKTYNIVYEVYGNIHL
jgi:hypothetical protein